MTRVGPAAPSAETKTDAPKKKLFIKTYGCQMNAYDSARMAELLAPLGYDSALGPDEADLVIVNTCHIREKAEAKLHSELGRLRVLKDERARRGERMLLAVAGCVAQAEGDELLRAAPAIDLVLGPQALHRLPGMVARAIRANGMDGAGPIGPRPIGGAPIGAGIVETGFEVERKFDSLPEARLPQGPAAYLTIQEGCDRFCSFCVVPYTRGAEYSRPVAAILAEARALAAAGAVEITLLGQNVNAYHGAASDGASWGLGRLLRHLAANVPDLARLRYTTSHPRDMDTELIEAHRALPQLMPFLHLPVQSGSDRILKAMGRGHRAADYRRLIDKLRAARPDLALSSDFIVGFPGESDEDFAATLALVREIGFAQAYSFIYSARPGTPAAALPGQISESVKAERLAVLQAAIAEQQIAFNRASIGQTMSVLLDRKGRRPGQLAGRSPYMQAVHLEAPEELLGALRDIEITAAHGVSLKGRLPNHAASRIASTEEAMVTG